MGVTVYGIPNCDSVKKARKQLDTRCLAYAFHDFKEQGVPEDKLRNWVTTKGWETLLNRKGTTWRALDDATRQAVTDAETAIAVMLAHPSTIKRPVVEAGSALVVGVDLAALGAL